MFYRLVPAFICSALLCASPAVRAEDPAPPSAPNTDVEIHLLTMGPGDHLYTRGGHASLMVAEMRGGRPINTRVFNYGDTDWESRTILSDFLHGRLIFFLSSSGDLAETVTTYGVDQNRSLYRQKLNLTPSQARRVVERLEAGLLPGNREYRYHHVEAICTTKIRDLLNEVTDGALASQLGGKTDAHTIRDYIDWGFSGWWGASLGSDLLMARMHDDPISEYYVLFQPRRMREIFPEVMLEHANGVKVALAEPPTLLAERQGPPAITGPNRFPTLVAWLFLLIVGIGAFAVYGRLPLQPKPAGLWLLLWSIPSASIGITIAFLALFSDVPQLRVNELIIAFPPTDLFLLLPAIGWLRGHAGAGSLLRIYAGVRVGTLLLLGVGRIVGLFYQQPVIWFWVGAVCAVSLWSMMRGMRVTKKRDGDHSGPLKSTYLAYMLGNILLRLTGWRIEGSLPEKESRFVVIAAPHTSNWDGFYMLVVAAALGYRVNFIGKRAVFYPPLGWLMRALGGVPVDRRTPQGMVQQMAERIREAPAITLGVPPAGTRAKRDHWKSGFYHIALAADVPVACSFLDYKRKAGGIGPILRLSGEVCRDMDRVREFYAGITARHPELLSAVRLIEEDDAAAKKE